MKQYLKDFSFGLMSTAAVCLGFTQVANAATVTFKDGSTNPIGSGTYTGTEDTSLVINGNFDSNQNFGKRGDFGIGERNDDPSFINVLRRGFIRFDVSSMDGQFSAINSIKLRLFITDYDALLTGDIQGADDLQVFRLAEANSGWVEGTGIRLFSGINLPDTGESTWDQRVQGSENWAGSAGAGTPGVDYLTPLLGSVGFDSTNESVLEGTALEIEFNDVSFFSDWVNGNNPGLFLRTKKELDAGISVFSSDATDASVRPELVVTYDLPIQPIPTPALLPGLIGMGVAAIRKRKQEAEAEV